MQAHRTARRMAQRLGDPAPHPARGPEFRDGHELIVVGGQPEAQLTQCRRHTQTPGREQSEVVGGRTDDAGEFPRGVGTAIVQGGTVHADRTRTEVRGPAGDRLHLGHRGRGAAADGGGQGIGAEIDRRRRPPPVSPIPLPGEQVEHRLGGRAEVGAAVQSDRGQREIDAPQQPVQAGGRHAVRAQSQDQRGDAVDQGVEHRGVGILDRSGESGGRELLGHLPPGKHIAVPVPAAHERPFAGQCGLRHGVQRGVQRADRKSLVGRGIQQPLRLSLVRRRGPAAAGEHTRDRAAPPVARTGEGLPQICGHRRLLLWSGGWDRARFSG